MRDDLLSDKDIGDGHQFVNEPVEIPSPLFSISPEEVLQSGLLGRRPPLGGGRGG